MAAGGRVPALRRPPPAAGLISVLVASLAGLAMFGTLSGLFLPDYFLSSYTQRHGIPDTGTISNVSNTRSDRGSWSATVQITLDRPVDGATSTTLQVGNAVNSPDATHETVLVDPQDPAHAEYPGRPTYPLQLAVILLSCTGVSALLFASPSGGSLSSAQEPQAPAAPARPPPAPARHALLAFRNRIFLTAERSRQQREVPESAQVGT